MKKVLLLIIVSLVFAGVASARTVWRPQLNTPPIVAPAVGDWMDAGNWDNGVPTSDEFGDPCDPLNQTGKAVFYDQGATAECWVTTPDPICYYFVLGDNEPLAAPLVIKNGGTLTTGGNWSGVGYNQVAEMIVERGGTLTCGNHLWVGMNAGADATLIVDGGTITVADALGLGRNGPVGEIPAPVAEVYLNAGLIECRYMGRDTFVGQPSFIDIAFGTLVFTNNNLTRANALIGNGDIIGFGGASTVTAESIDGDVYITADTDPLGRTPTMDALVYGGPVTLSWTNLPPVSPAIDVWVDVWFGTDASWAQIVPTDPNIWGYVDFTKVVDAGLNTASKGVTTVSVGEETYFWKVNTYRNGDPAIPGLYEDLPDDGDPNTSEEALYDVDEGILMVFGVTDDFPPSVVIDTLSTVTWKNVPIQLDATITDDAGSPVNILWTSEDPNAVFSPSNIVEDPTVEVNYATNAFDVTITVTDDAGSDAATLGLQCRQDACDAARYLGTQPEDIDADCAMNPVDFAAIAGKWLYDYTLLVPTEIP